MTENILENQVREQQLIDLFVEKTGLSKNFALFIFGKMSFEDGFKCLSSNEIDLFKRFSNKKSINSFKEFLKDKLGNAKDYTEAKELSFFLNMLIEDNTLELLRNQLMSWKKKFEFVFQIKDIKIFYKELIGLYYDVDQWSFNFSYIVGLCSDEEKNEKELIANCSILDLNSSEDVELLKEWALDYSQFYNKLKEKIKELKFTQLKMNRLVNGWMPTDRPLGKECVLEIASWFLYEEKKVELRTLIDSISKELYPPVSAVKDSTAADLASTLVG